MNTGTVDAKLPVSWEHGQLRLELDIDTNDRVYLRSVQPTYPHNGFRWQSRTSDFSALPLNEVRLAGEGSQFTTSKRQVQGYLANRLRYVSHSASDEEDCKHLEVKTQDEQSGTSVNIRFSVFPSLPVLRSTLVVTNTGKSP